MSQRKFERADLLSVGDLRDRGWTPAMIRGLLGEPDDTRPNPRYVKAAPMRFWLAERVEEAESTDAFRARLAKAQSRSKSGKATARAKEAALHEELAKIRVTVKTMGLDAARRSAIASYNAHHADDPDMWASRDSDRAFLDRITVNYLRHERTSYDELGEALAGRIGRQSGHALLRNRILDEIARRYPDLADECRAQSTPID